MMSNRRSLPRATGVMGKLPAALILGWATGAFAFPLCYEAARQMARVGQQLDVSDRAVVAQPTGDASHFRVIAAVKGSDAVGATVVDPVTSLDASAPAGCNPCLLLHDPVARQWTAL